MKISNSKLVICGTDTDVGKTIVSALLVQGLQSTYWKPIQSGVTGGTDTDHIRKILSLPSERIIPEVYKFQAPVSPHWAAEKESSCILIEKLNLPSSLPEKIVIETAGGLMVPLTRNFLQLEQLEIWRLPIVLVARSGLGTINHTLLSIEALKNRKIPILGVVFNGPVHQDNPKTISDFSNIPVIAELPFLNHLNSKSIQNEWDRQNLNIKFTTLLKRLE